MKPFMHGKVLPSLDISGFYLLFWLAYYLSRMFDDQVITDCPDHVLPIQMTPRDLPYLSAGIWQLHLS